MLQPVIVAIVINGSWNSQRICSEPQLDRHLKDLLTGGLVFRFFCKIQFCNYRVIVSREKLKIDIHNESVIIMYWWESYFSDKFLFYSKCKLKT